MITAQDFLDFADGMACHDEASDRVCISRAYYAAMHKALEYALKQGYQYNRKEAGGTHNNLIFYYEKLPDDDSQLIADLLRKLKHRREQADYRLEHTIFSSHASTAIYQAKIIFGMFN